MEPNTLRLPATTWQELADEADDLGFHSRSAYLRWILQHRDVIESNTDPNTPPNTHRTRPNTGANTPEYDALADKVAELERRIADDPAPPAADTPADRDLDGVEFPASRERGECATAVYAARDHLREHGPASMRELVAAVMPAYPVGYDVPDLPLPEGERFRGGWWRHVVRPGLDALPDVEKPTGGGEWRYTGE